MSGGINHAKQIVIDEAKCLADKLQNGSAGCAQTQGKAIALLVKMVIPMFSAEFITVGDCEECKEKRSNIKTSKNLNSTKLKVGPITIEGPITSALIVSLTPLLCLGGVIFMAGKMQSWW